MHFPKPPVCELLFHEIKMYYMLHLLKILHIMVICEYCSVQQVDECYPAEGIQLDGTQQGKGCLWQDSSMPCDRR